MRHRTFPCPSPVFAALLVGALTIHAPAQEEASVRATGQTATSSASARLLHLSSGFVFRGKAREVEGGWEIWQRGEWVALPSEVVLRSISEKEVLKRSRKLDRASRGDSGRRAAFADWLLGEGLYPEGLKVLDVLLRESPDHPQACAVLELRDPPLSLPSIDSLARDAAQLEVLLESCAKGGPVIQESAAQRLRSAPEISGLEDRLLSELHEKRASRRTFATLALRRVFPARHVRPLLARAVLDVCDEVRLGAALALAQVGDPAVCVPAIRALGSKHSTVRRNAAQALGRMNYRAAVAPLMGHLTSLKNTRAATDRGAPRSHIFIGRQLAYVQDFDVEIAQNSSIADPIINVLIEGVVLEASSVGIHETTVAQERSTVRRSLSNLTGAQPGNNTAAWQRWWTEHGDEWLADLPSGPPSTPLRRGN